MKRLIGPLVVAVVLSVLPTLPQQADAQGSCAADTFFTDVAASSYSYDAVVWALCEGITTGTTATTFSPRSYLTRGQLATLLWRYDGEPAAGPHPFSDVPTGIYFEDPVKWLSASGITTGTTATTFSPSALVTRGQMATFLWRYEGEPAAASSSFVDVPTGQYYTTAVGWMAATGITTGTTATTFSPRQAVTREQAVTFLWRHAGSPTPPPPPPPPPPPSGRFETLPVGAPLPSGAECAARVRPAAEIRPENAAANANRGSRAVANNRSDWSQFDRIDGNFAGTTDEIIQWAACKWGIDEDIARAQVIKESYWRMSANGDNGESWGLGQVRDTAHQSAFEFSSVNARNSSAYNLDYTYASWRACYEGVYTWLNTVERNGTYAAGDVWGCLGVWFSGRWYVNTQAYLYQAGDSVSFHYNNRTWETQVFING